MIRSLLPRSYQTTPYYSLKHHALTLQGAVQPEMLFRSYFYVILARLRVVCHGVITPPRDTVPSLVALSTALLGALTYFSAYLLL